MRASKLVSAAVFMVAVFSLSFGYAFAGPPEHANGKAGKVDVCHYDADSDTFHLINVSQNALQAHLDHGDLNPGDPVPGSPGSQFEDDCEVFSPFKLADVTVPGTTSTPTAGPVLMDGVEYELRVQGTYKFANWATAGQPDAGYADAQCSHRGGTYGGSTVGWVNGDDLPTPWENWLEVNYGSGDAIAWSPGTCDVTNHEYTASVVGDGAAISFVIMDDAYGDNSGALTVEIWQMTP